MRNTVQTVRWQQNSRKTKFLIFDFFFGERGVTLKRYHRLFLFTLDWIANLMAVVLGCDGLGGGIGMGMGGGHKVR